MTATRKAYRAAILHSIADPAEVGLEASQEYYEDGLLVVEPHQRPRPRQRAAADA
jgi:guanine deaminase